MPHFGPKQQAVVVFARIGEANGSATGTSSIDAMRVSAGRPRLRRNQFSATIQNWPAVNAALISTMNVMKSRRSTCGRAGNRLESHGARPVDRHLENDILFRHAVLLEAEVNGLPS